MNVRVSMFVDAYGTEPKDCELAAVLDAIRGGRYAAQVAAIRATYASTLAETGSLEQAKDAISAAKKELPAFFISGTAESRSKLAEFSNLIQVDLDKLNGNSQQLREKLKDDPHVAFLFLSPSGDGLKLGVAADCAHYEESYLAVKRYFREKYSAAIDDGAKGLTRLCFVSHDPDLWTRPDAVPLPIIEPKPEASDSDTPMEASAELSIIVLPSGAVSISESARVIFQRLAPTRTLFWRGGALVELVTVDGVQSLEVLKPEKFCSDVEKLGRLYAWRAAGQGESALKPAHMNVDLSKRILAASEAREFLPSVASILRCPVLVETKSGDDVAILGRGYHDELGGLLIVDGEEPPRVALGEAVAALHWLVDEFSFQDEGDRSRALAAFLTPALRLGGFLNGKTEHAPIDVAEADQSQSGKGYRHNLVCALYNEKPYLVTAKVGGVGSVDESFQSALIAARPFICLDNFRGRMDSQHLEAFLTCPGLFPARIPYKGEALLDPKRFILQMSSNGLETTRDLANRASICRIRKRPGFQYRDTLGELQKRQPYFLGCVFTVVTEWICNGKPRTKDTRHDFRDWCQPLDWIVQNIFGGAPLMDDHQAAQERTSNPALAWLRAVALAVDAENRLGSAFIASELVEVCELHSIEIPGKPADEDRAKMQVGSLCKQIFRDGDSIKLDGFTVSRGRKEYRKQSGDLDTTNAYTFTR